ncbi:hypothetical protein MAJ_06771, partial [Metarhizium majus ARSEF 297]
MANRLAYLADVHHLLPSRHTGGRKFTSTEHAAHFLLQGYTRHVLRAKWPPYYYLTFRELRQCVT